jgi:branched-chain amino acid transport system permease protein
VETIIAAGLSGLSLGTQYALIAIGFTLIFGIMGVINFAHGGFYVLGGYIAYALIAGLGMPFAFAVVLAAIGTAIAGYLVEVLIVHKHVEDHLSTMLITLGLYLMMTTLFQSIFGAEAVTFSFPITGGLRWNGLYLSYPSMIVIGICIVAIAVVYYLVFKTRYGIALRAMADNASVATAQGIRPKHMFPMAFALASGLAGLTGALVAPLLSLEPHTGDNILGKAFVVVILGGLGSISGAVAAAMLVGFIEAYASVYFGGSRGALILFVILMIVLLVRPQGLLGTVSRKA